MFFRDDSCISENTIRYYHDYRIHELMQSDWFGIMSLSRSGSVRIDNRYDVSSVGDSHVLNFVHSHADELQIQDYKYKQFEYAGSYYLVCPIRINERGYLIFFLHCRLRAPFEDKDVQWYSLFADAAYKRTLLNNELIQQHNYMSSVMESSQDIMVVLDPIGNTVSFNVAAEELLGEEAENICHSRFSQQAKNQILQLTGECISTDSKRRIKNATAEVGDVEHIFDLTISPLSNSKGIPSGVVLVGNDITDRQVMEYEFEQLKHYTTLGEISLGLAHDVKNPLMNIRSCVTLLEHNSALRESDGDLLETIVGEVERINSTITQMLSFGKVAKENTYTLVSINEILENCVQILYRQKAYRRVEIHYLPSKPVPLIKAKNSDMQQVFLNVLLNSMEAIDESGRIDISSFYDAGQKKIHVTIADDGCGISQESMKNLFNPYYTTKPNGTGLGLFMVKRVLKQYQGSIHIESMKWQETVCTITLPCE